MKLKCFAAISTIGILLSFFTFLWILNKHALTSNPKPILEGFPKVLLIHSSFFDSRSLDGHVNSTVILIQPAKHIMSDNLIVGCGVDNRRADSFKLSPYYQSNWVHIHYPYLTHDEAMLRCYDLPMNNDSEAFVLYLPMKASTKLVKESIKITQPSQLESNAEGKLVVCTRCYNKPPWIFQWLRYQKAIGVDLVHLYVEETFMSNTEILAKIRPLIQEGFLKIDFRQSLLDSKQIFDHSQTLSYNDCMYRYSGVYEYAMFIDTDDFFVPRLPGITSIKYYLKKYFKKDIAAIRFHWYRYFPDCGLKSSLDDIKDGNVTDHLWTKYHVDTFNSKSVSRPALMRQVVVHEPLRMLEGYIEGSIPDGTEVHMAHVRSHQRRGLPTALKCIS